jgi:hypothetical protein
VGESDKEARVTVHAPQNIATASLVVAPDPAQVTPRIRRLGNDHIQSGRPVTVEGEHFLSEARGTIQLNCPGIRRVFMGQIQSWSDTRVNVLFMPPVAGLERSPCELSLRNHRGLSDSRPVNLSVAMDIQNVTLHVRLRTEVPRQDPGRRGIFDVSVGTLINGWVVRSTGYELTRDGQWRDTTVTWLRRPTPGSADTSARVQISPRTPGDPDAYPREFRYIVTIEGPAGLPYR